jgi:hypothetical protein
MLITGNDLASKEQVTQILADFGWFRRRSMPHHRSSRCPKHLGRDTCSLSAPGLPPGMLGG